MMLEYEQFLVGGTREVLLFVCVFINIVNCSTVDTLSGLLAGSRFSEVNICCLVSLLILLFHTGHAGKEWGG